MVVPPEQLASPAELQATLDAAFALIDDCLASTTDSLDDAFWGSELSAGTTSDGTSTSSSPPSSPAPTSCADLSTPTKPTTWPSATVSRASRPILRVDSTKAPGKKRASFQIRQKEEIARLRQEAVQLEACLELLRTLREGAKANTHRVLHDTPSTTDGMVVVATVNKPRLPSRPELAALWKDMAARHKKLRGVSEAENTKLRLQVAEQLKAIRSIQKLLRRQTTRYTEPISRPVQVIRTDTSVASSTVMAMLSDEINAMYRSVDVALQLYGLRAPTTVPIQERLFQPSPTSFVAQVIESHLMPFNFRDTAETMWDFSMSLCAHSDFFRDQTTTERGGALFRSYEMAHSGPGHDFTVKGDHVIRKFVEPERFVFLNSGIARPTIMRGENVSGVVCHETGRVVISHVPRAAGSSGDLCCFQTCLEVIVEVDGAPLSGKALARDFRKLLVAFKVQSFEFFQDTLEALLLRKQRSEQLVGADR